MKNKTLLQTWAPYVTLHAFAGKIGLTAKALFTGIVIAAIIFAGTGMPGIFLLLGFFILGSISTAVGKAKNPVIEGATGSPRTTGQVIANAGVAALLSITILAYPPAKNICMLMLAAAFSSAAADTMSSELGNVYGTRYYNIISLKKDKRGLDGVISLEGTLCGIAGSMAIALTYAAYYGFATPFYIIIMAGTAGNITDSILGTAAERKKLLSNNGVNLLNTVAAAIAAFIFTKIFM